MLWIVLAACQTPTPPLVEADPAALRVTPLRLFASELAIGADAALRATGAAPGATVVFLAGRPGVTCPPGLNACLDLASPRALARVAADATGAAVARVALPAAVPAGAAVQLQAVSGPEVSWSTRRIAQAAGTTIAPPMSNLLVVVADDLGVDKVGAYGYPNAAPTPNLDALAADGVTFRNAWSMPYCSPARAAMLTGRLPRRTGIGTNFGILDYPNGLGLAQTLLPELLAASPWGTYSSSFAGKWHLGSHAGPGGIDGPVAQGYGWWAGAMGNLQNARDVTVFTEPPGYTHWEKVQDGRLIVSNTYATTDTADDAIARIGAMPEPWHLVVAMHAAHEPWHVPPVHLHTDPTLTDADSAWRRERAMVEAMDSEVGRVLSSMAPEVRGRTLVVFAGDNGTPSRVIAPPFDPERSKGDVFDNGIRVPLIVSGAGVVQPGRTSEALVQLTDLFATAAAVAGVDLAAFPGVADPGTRLAHDSVSWMPYLTDPSAPDQRTTITSEIFATEGPPPYLYKDQVAIRDARYKLIRDRIHGVDTFFAYAPGQTDEGPDLLPCGLTVDQQAAYDALSSELEAQLAERVWDEVAWVPLVRPEDTGVTGDTAAVGDSGAPVDTAAPADTAGRADTGLPACAVRP
jgi:arylsulfatase B